MKQNILILLCYSKHSLSSLTRTVEASCALFCCGFPAASEAPPGHLPEGIVSQYCKSSSKDIEISLLSMDFTFQLPTSLYATYKS